LVVLTVRWKLPSACEEEMALAAVVGVRASDVGRILVAEKQEHKKIVDSRRLEGQVDQQEEQGRSWMGQVWAVPSGSLWAGL
jgi:hypothetical protein